MNNGWISLHRKITKWEWYDDANTFRVFVHCLLLANHSEKNWRGNIVNRGQLITSQSHLGIDLGLSVQSIRTCLDKLKSTGELTVKITNKFSIISITNYDSFQDSNRQDNIVATTNQQSTNSQATGNQQQTITKTIKPLNNDNKRERKKRFTPPSIENIKEAIKDKNYSVDAEIFFNHYESNGWKVGKNQMKSWMAALANWNSRENNHNPKATDYADKIRERITNKSKSVIDGECHAVE